MYRRQSCAVRLCPEVLQATLHPLRGDQAELGEHARRVSCSLPSVTVTRLLSPGVNAIVVCW